MTRVIRAIRGGLTPPLVLATGYAVLLLSWAVANPPFASPDEPAHYLRAIAVGGGSYPGEAAVTVPAGLWTTRDPACNKFRPELSAACLDRLRTWDREVTVESAAGLYPPLAYVLPGAAARVAGDVQRANRAARLVTVAISAALFLVAIVLLWAPGVGALSLLGVIVATTPMVLFVSSMQNSSALETGAGLVFAAGLLRLSRPHPSGAWVWGAVATSGALLALSRSTGILWLVFDVALVYGLVGTTRVRQIVRTTWIAAAAAGAVLLAAIVANRAWERTYGTDVTQSGPLAYSWSDKIGEAFTEFDRLAREWIGTFGWLDTSIPLWGSLAWLAIIVGLLLTAFAVGRARERLTLVAALALAAGAASVLSATLRAGELGGDVQARHLMPFLVMLPLLAGEIVTRSPVRARGAGNALAAVLAVTAGLHVIAWYWNARRHATGVDGSIFFLPEPEWSPPLGWVLWLAVTVVAASLTLLWALVDSGQSGRRRPKT